MNVLIVILLLLFSLFYIVYYGIKDLDRETKCDRRIALFAFSNGFIVVSRSGKDDKDLARRGALQVAVFDDPSEMVWVVSQMVASTEDPDVFRLQGVADGAVLDFQAINRVKASIESLRQRAPSTLIVFPDMRYA